MAKILVLYYSMYGHIEKMANAVAEGARSVKDTKVAIKRIPEILVESAAKKSGVKFDQEAPLATISELPIYDAIIFGTPTRFGNMSAQMRNFLDHTGKLWRNGDLVGKVGSIFTSTGKQHGDQETTVDSFNTTLLHQGMIIVSVPYLCKKLLTMGEITCAEGHRQPFESELKIAQFQGEHVTRITKKISIKD